MSDLSHPAAVLERLAEIENDLAIRQNELEDAALQHFRSKRDREHDRATAFLAATGTVAERSAVADRNTALQGSDEEGRWEGLRAVVRVLEARASIGQSILRAQSRIA